MRKAHVLGLIGSAISIGIGALLLTNLEPAKYSDRWFKSLSREELDVEREQIQKQWETAGNDYSLSIWLQRMLYRFDAEIRLRKYGVVRPEDYVYPAHQEHGHNLYKSD